MYIKNILNNLQKRYKNQQVSSAVSQLKLNIQKYIVFLVLSMNKWKKDLK